MKKYRNPFFLSLLIFVCNVGKGVCLKEARLCRGTVNECGLVFKRIIYTV